MLRLLVYRPRRRPLRRGAAPLLVAPLLALGVGAAGVVVTVAASAGCSSGGTVPLPETPFPDATRAALDAAVAKTMADFGFPGAAVGIWMPGKGNYVATHGAADPATGRALQRGDHFRIGSITKTFTITALLRLADEKKLSLNDPVSKYLDFVPNGQNITLRMMANMTSGLFNYSEDDPWVDTIFGDTQRVWTPRELVDVGLKHDPYFDPGQGWHYSNTNTVLLGMVIEKVTGKPVGEVFAEKLFRPLGLKNTNWPASSAIPAPFARGVTEQTLDGKRADATERNPSWAYTAGQIISTLDDLKVWVRSYATGSLLSREMQAERLTWVTLPPNTPQRAYGLGIGTDNGWLGHTGELPGYNTAAFFLPEQDAVIVVMVNSDIPKDKLNPAPALFKALAEVVTPGNVPH